MKKLQKETYSAEETKALGEILGQKAEADMVFLLDGDLGAGKTTLTQGIARGLGISRHVTSPTFTIHKVYQGRLVLHHIDAYRLEGISQDLGFDEVLEDGGLTVMEWSAFTPDLIPANYLRIAIRLKDDDNRVFEFEAHGEAYEKLLEEIA